MKAQDIMGARAGTVREYTTQDKSAWGYGAWQDEPDKVQWIDDATDMDCLIVRGPSGALCGYVGVLPSHPLHGKEYSMCTQPTPCEEVCCDHTPMHALSAHGGITYSDFCAHSEDESRGICHIPVGDRPDTVYWFGFDCAHYGDVTPKYDNDEKYGRSLRDGSYKSVRYVAEEVRRLAEQLKSHGQVATAMREGR
jgi:hypothetical protein